MEAIDETVTVQTYPAYKDSGIDWLGEIPAHWEVKKSTHLFQKIGSGTTPASGNPKYYDGDINWLQTGDLTDNLITTTSKKITQKAIDNYSTLKKYPSGSLVVAMYGATIGKVGLLKIECTTNQACCVLSNLSGITENYAFYFLIRSKSFIVSQGYGGGQPNISQEVIRSLRIPLPPLEEQTSIAEFLDRKTAQIDKAIAQKERLVELLNERRQVLIHRAVTRGLNPNVPLKDSGIDWIGEIPAHWEVKKLKYILKERNDKSETGLETLFMVSQEHGLVVRADYHDKAIAGQNSVGSKRVFYNDLVFNKLKAHLGVFFKSTIEEVGLVSPDYAVYYSNGTVEDLKYLELLFRHPAYIRQFICSATGIVEGLIRLYTGDLFNIRIPVPPKHEQKELLDSISKISQKIEFALKRAENQIQKLQELKATLINSAVTGKIKV